MANDDGIVWITFNGEIFNYVELRARSDRARPPLPHRTPTPRSSSAPTRRWGRTASRASTATSPSRCGTRARGRLVLARDRMGVRPLYLHRARTARLLFASEVKALLRGAGRRRRARPDRARPDLHVLVPARPAHRLQGHPRAAAGARADRRGRSGIKVRPYWRLELSRTRGDGRAGDRPRSGRDCRGTARAAARRRRASGCAPTCRSAPISAAGSIPRIVDGAMQAASCRSGCARSRSRSRSTEFDESAFQQEMVRALGTEHSVGDLHARRRHRARLSRRDPRTPSGRSCAPRRRRSCCCRGWCARSGFKVVLTGEGADEVFAGYDIFKEAKLRRFCARQPGSRRRPLLLRRLYPYLPACRRQSQSYLEAFFAAGRDAISPTRCSRTCRVSAPRPAPRLLLRRPARGAHGLRRGRRAARQPAGRVRALASAVAGAVSGERLSPAGLHPVLAGRPRGDGACGRGAFPVPRPPRGRVRLAHSAEAEDPRAAREAHPARSRARPAAGSDRQPAEAALPRARQPGLRRRRTRRPMSRRRCRPPTIDGAGIFDAARGREAAQKCRSPRRLGLPRQHGVRRRAVDAALASRHSCRAPSAPRHDMHSRPSPEQMEHSA